MASNLQEKIVANLIFNEDYARKVYPFVKTEYFDAPYSTIIDVASQFFQKYNQLPHKDELKIELKNRRGLTDKQLNDTIKALDGLRNEPSDPRWLMETTEKHFKEQSVFNAIVKSAGILENEKGNRGEILTLVQNALSVSFDTNVGHDYFEDYEKRYAEYHKTEDKVSWGIRSLDEITNGGMSKKTLNCIVAPSGVGKSAIMCSIASNVLRQGMNVLYITLEMSETRIAERIDANLMHTTINNIREMSEKTYLSKIEALKTKTTGKLIIKEYPTSSASVLHFKALLEELKTKRNFVPDLIVVDYLNIATSSRVRIGQTNSYGFIKAISEELRGLAVEYNVAMLTATQTNRSGFNNSDIEMTDVSESIGMTFVLDFQIALIRTEQMDEQNQVMIKQLKNRYGDLTKHREIYLGFNRDEMRFYDADTMNSNMKETFGNMTPISANRSDNQKPTNDFNKFTF